MQSITSDELAYFENSGGCRRIVSKDAVNMMIANGMKFDISEPDIHIGKILLQIIPAE